MKKEIGIILVGCHIELGRTHAVVEALAMHNNNMHIIVLDENNIKEEQKSPIFIKSEQIMLKSVLLPDNCFEFIMDNEKKRQKQQEKFRRRHSK